MAAMLVGVVLPARTQVLASGCNISLDQVRLAHPLPRFAHKLVSEESITIVAVGSSSTAGAGASSAAASYPNQLAAELKQHFPNHSITVINRGVGGEEVGDMLKRFDNGVLAEHPDLVLWQLGTNSVIRNHQLSDTSIHDGLNKIRAVGADVVLIDPQYAPRVIAKPKCEGMVSLIAATAKAEHVGVFHRFELMRRWHETDHLPFETFISADGLHMNDWSYGCLAKALAVALAEAINRPTATAVGSSFAR